MKAKLFILTLASCLYLTACSGNSGSSNPSGALTLGGTVSGLTGSGLVLQDNHQGYLAVAANGAFTFSNTFSSGDAYNVNVLTQPSNPTQFCSVVNGIGTASGNVSNVQINCGNSYTIGGTVSGLTAVISLENNGSDQITFSANGPFTFDQNAGTGSTYAVTVSVQPAGQTCSVANGTGTVANSNVINVQVTCAASTFSISGTVYGLSGSGLTLQDDGGDNIPVSVNGNFTFATKIADDSTYYVSVLTQPSNPTQTCRIPNGSGTPIANVTGIQVVCSNGAATTNIWTWESGTNQVDGASSYGSLGVPAPTNVPPARGSAASWKDLAGNFWFFGGTAGEDVGYYNDLWEYSSGEWTWMSGSNSLSQAGSYGTLGVASPSNVPQARERSVHWTDAAGNFWLFGGHGYVFSTNLSGDLSDLWEYRPGTGEWTWIGGPQGYNQPAVYGVMGTAAPGNIPGPRENPASWTDAAGNFWLFGGFGIDSAGAYGELNDIWKYDGTEWTWVGGSDASAQTAVYGVQGTASASNTPGGREGGAVWTDTSGNFWLFGGFGIVSAGNYGDFNDLWEYTAGEWTWIGGSNMTNQVGSYGILGTASSTNIPTARDGASAWTDTSGNFWLLGGEDAVGNLYNDLWEYSGGQWTWLGGSNACCQTGVYGTLGTPALTNVPGARYRATSWTDSSGNFWLFGGSDTTSIAGEEFNDLWKYQP